MAGLKSVAKCDAFFLVALAIAKHIGYNGRRYIYQ